MLSDREDGCSTCGFRRAQIYVDKWTPWSRRLQPCVPASRGSKLCSRLGIREIYRLTTSTVPSYNGVVRCRCAEQAVDLKAGFGSRRGDVRRGGDMPVRGIRGAVQVDADDRESILDGADELVREALKCNEVEPADVISILFTATPDLTAEFPAY